MKSRWPGASKYQSENNLPIHGFAELTNDSNIVLGGFEFPERNVNSDTALTFSL